MSLNFAQVRLLTDDFKASFAYYTEVLGLAPKDPVDDPDNGPYACFTIGGTDMALFTRAYMDGSIGAVHSPRGREDHVVVVLRSADVDAAYAEYEKRGALTIAEPRDMGAWGMRVAHLRAPEGTLIELCQYED